MKMRFYSNAGMCPHSHHIIQIFRINYLLLLVCIAIASQELKTMSKTPLKMTFFVLQIPHFTTTR